MNDEEKKQSPKFDRRELWTALALYPAAYIYTFIAGPNGHIWFGVFVLLFVALTEYLNRGRPRAGESWVWLLCVLLITSCVVFGWGRVWERDLSMLFVHPLALWWVLSRSGALLEGESGHLLPADAFNGAVSIPFGNFFLRAGCVRRGLSGRAASGKKSVLPAAAAVLIAALLLYRTVASLAVADAGFERLVAGILEFLAPRDGAKLGELLLRFLVSLPVGAWLFGLLAGSRRLERSELDSRAARLSSGLLRLRAVPDRLGLVCMGVFAAVYLVFFALQGSYLFGAFTRTLPEGFIVSEYARQGFFELCRVMAINFALLWLVTRCCKTPVSESRAGKLMCTLLLLAGMLFAVVAISKLALYISCFGFTPKRLQSTWLAAVLLAGSAASVYSLWTGRKSFRLWLMFAAVTLSLLHLV